MATIDDYGLTVRRDLISIPAALRELYGEQFQEIYVTREQHFRTLQDHCIKNRKNEKEYEQEIPLFWYNKTSFQFTTMN
ncbi:MAG: hypothetical protein WC916_04065 [Candidatus Woesearchaeota archaeon]